MHTNLYWRDNNKHVAKHGSHKANSAIANHLTESRYQEKWVRPKLPEYKGTTHPEIHMVIILANMKNVTDRKDL